MISIGFIIIIFFLEICSRAHTFWLWIRKISSTFVTRFVFAILNSNSINLNKFLLSPPHPHFLTIYLMHLLKGSRDLRSYKSSIRMSQQTQTLQIAWTKLAATSRFTAIKFYRVKLAYTIIRQQFKSIRWESSSQSRIHLAKKYYQHKHFFSWTTKFNHFLSRTRSKSFFLSFLSALLPPSPELEILGSFISNSRHLKITFKTSEIDVF